MTMPEILGIIPARAGSKGIPGKNGRLLNGRPLLAYTAACARQCQGIGRLVLSTDSAKLAELGKNLGLEVPFLRPAAIADDHTPMLDVIHHALDFFQRNGYIPEFIVLLQPTSPLRRPEHITRALNLLQTGIASSVVSVVRVPQQLSPEYLLKLDSGNLLPYTDRTFQIGRRQDTDPVYYRDGTVYAFRLTTLHRFGNIYGDVCLPLELSPVDSLSLDSMSDWEEAERRLKSA
jgi:CMP-N,N'-diacetyllegionaminic acid synthase